MISFFRIFQTHVFDMSFFKLFVKLYTTIILVYLAFPGSTMVEDNYIRNKLESITITNGNSIIFDTGNINSCVVVSSTKSVILGNFSKLYLFNNTHTRSIGMFLVLLNNFDEPIKSGKCAKRFYNYMYSCLKYCNIYFTINGITYSSTKFGQLKKVLSSFLCSIEIPTHTCTILSVVLVCSSYSKILLCGMLV